MDLDKIKERMEEIAGSWNGDLPGAAEDRAMVALEVLDRIKEIEESLEYLNAL